MYSEVLCVLNVFGIGAMMFVPNL